MYGLSETRLEADPGIQASGMWQGMRARSAPMPVLPSPSSQDEPTTRGKGGLCHTYIILHHTESFVACSHNNLSQVFLCWSSVTAW